MSKPIIGITTMRTPMGTTKDATAHQEYASAVIEAGGIPFFIPTCPENNAQIYSGILDGIVFSGGPDISPRFMNEDPLIHLETYDDVCDQFQIDLLKMAQQEKLPTLAICRGCQIVNVALGGNLYQDLDSEYPNAILHHPSGVDRGQKHHLVFIDKDSELFDITHTTELYTNSFHHQGLKRLADCLEPMAHAGDKVCESYRFKDLDDWYLLGIQWHPESMIYGEKAHLDIYKKLIEKAKAYKNR